jgi:hypothetical protein
LLAEALSLHFYYCRVMNQPVDCRHCHHVVIEDLVPGAEGLIRGNYQTSRFISMGNQLKEHLRFVTALFHIADVVDNQNGILVHSGKHLRQR